LNIPPDPRGLIHETDVERLYEFSDFIRETFKENLARDIAISDVVTLPDTATFNLLVLGEDIAHGQRIHTFAVDCWQDGEWQHLVCGTTIGYKRILEVPPTSTTGLRFSFESEKGTPMITTFGLYRDARKGQ